MESSSSPLVSVALAVHNDARFLPLAIESVLRQTVSHLELIVVDDASTDQTPSLLARISDPRLVVITNDHQLGLAASLNSALERARGAYFARLDADDVALPERLALQLERVRNEPVVSAVGTGVLDLDADGRPGRLHEMPVGPRAVSWHSLFAAPLIHPTLLVSRAIVEENGLRYDPAYVESEDYDFLARLLAVAAGANLLEPLVLKRVHAGQASRLRSGLQTSFQRQVALREIARVVPDLAEEDRELAWGLGSGRGVPDGSLEAAASAYLTLLAAFERRNGFDSEVREWAVRTLLRAKLPRRVLKLGASYPARLAFRRARRQVLERGARRRAASWLTDLATPARLLRVAVVSPEPTPYRSPLFDRVAARPEIDLTVIYAARTVAGRAWAVEPRHRAVFLSGVSVPGARRVLRHDYPVTPGIGRALRTSRPDVVVVSGWSTFASQAAIAWSRTHRIPYVLLVESHDLDPRAAWRRAVKGAVVPRILGGASGVLAVGAAATESVVARGARRECVRIFANTIDVSAWTRRAQQLERRRADEDVLVLSVARLVPEKGLDDLIRALAEAGDPRLRLVVAGDGSERNALVELADELGVGLSILGHVTEADLAQLYVDADVFALLSRHEPWGVAVNEAAASGLPLLLSDHVGAASDLLADGRNGFLVPAGDVHAAAAALNRLAGDSALRHELGARSRELVRDWGYEPSVENFVAAVREATSR